LNFEFPETPRGEVVIFRGVELSEAALESYREIVGRFFTWSMFASFTENREEADEYGRAWRGGILVLFELRSAWCRRLRNGTYLLHPFAVLQVEAVAGNVVKLVEVEGLEPGLVSPLTARRPRVVAGDGKTELHAAGRDGDIRAIARFANSREFLNAGDESGSTPLHVAAGYGQTEAVRALVWFGAEVNRSTSDGATPVFFAAQEGNELMLVVLVSLGADVNTATNKGCAPVYIASQNGNVSMVQLLVSLGANVNTTMGEGWTPLMMASGCGWVAVVAELLKAGASPEARTSNGVTALDVARAQGQTAVVALLEKVRAGSKID
jgi:ankyrin repeat protein